MAMVDSHAHTHSVSSRDLGVLSFLTQDSFSSGDLAQGPLPHAHSHAHPHPHAHPVFRKRLPDRRPVGVQDPLMVAAAASAGPDVTRNHYLHEFFPHPIKGAYSNCDVEVPPYTPSKSRLTSQQAPRTVRLAKQLANAASEAKSQPVDTPESPSNGSMKKLEGASSPSSRTLLLPGSSQPKKARRLSVSDPEVAKVLRTQPSPSSSPAFLQRPLAAGVPPSKPPLVVQCHVRTRIPTPHGNVFLYLYKNNHDDKEHLAFVADKAQMNVVPGELLKPSLPHLRSRSLDAEWREGETEMERIVRGAYVGRLSASTIVPSLPSVVKPEQAVNKSSLVEPPLARIHSECFTGEVIGSQRCDCGEQLDEAFRLITEAGRGVIVYLRQEGRGIGLLEKMRAYNLQDLGHDTVAANLLLGHGADMRTYDVAGAILRDLGVPEVRLLTNNPDKIEQIEREGITVVERVAMVPRAWTTPAKKPSKATARKSQRRNGRTKRMSGVRLLALAEQAMASQAASSSDEGERDGEDVGEDETSEEEEEAAEREHRARRAGVGMIGAGVTRSAELEKYLRTKVAKMGHMLSPPATPPPSRSESPGILSQPTSPKARSSTKRQSELHPLASSIASLDNVTDEGSLHCGSGCEQCGVEAMATSASSAEDGEA